MSQKAVCAIALACALAVPALSVKKKPATPEPAAIPQMSDDQRILHALNRLAYGPRPGDVEAVKKMGLNNWIEAQLNPQSFADNPQLVAKLAPLDTLVMPADAMIESYPPPQLIKAMVDGRIPFPEDPLTRIMIRRQVERYNIAENQKTKKSPQAEAASKRTRPV